MTAINEIITAGITDTIHGIINAISDERQKLIRQAIRLERTKYGKRISTRQAFKVCDNGDIRRYINRLELDIRMSDMTRAMFGDWGD